MLLVRQCNSGNYYKNIINAGLSDASSGRVGGFALIGWRQKALGLPVALSTSGLVVAFVLTGAGLRGKFMRAATSKTKKPPARYCGRRLSSPMAAGREEGQSD